MSHLDPISCFGHPFSGIDEKLKSRAEKAFAPVGKADLAAPVGVEITVIRAGNMVLPLSSPRLLISLGADQPLSSLSGSKCARMPALSEALSVALDAVSNLSEMPEYLDFEEAGFAASDLDMGLHMRSLWIFPHVAALMDNIHSCCIDEERHLPRLAVFFQEPALSEHERLIRVSELNQLAQMISDIAIPIVRDEWPEGYPQDKLSFRPFTPEDIFVKR